MRDAPPGCHRARGALVLLVCLLALAACERQAGQAQEGAEDPFTRLDLVRVTPRTPAPDFTVPRDPAGRLSLADFRERVVLVNFWATWCPPCQQEMASMERLYQRYRDRGFTILAVSIDRNVPAVAPFVKGFGLTFPIGLDPESAVAGTYRVYALPTTIVVDRAGRMAAGAAGARDWDSPAASAVIETLLGERTP